jgi:hypothetical protein
MQADRRPVDLVEAVVNGVGGERRSERGERGRIADVDEASLDGRLADQAPIEPCSRHGRRQLVLPFDPLELGHHLEVGPEAGERLEKGSDAL